MGVLGVLASECWNRGVSVSFHISYHYSIFPAQTHVLANKLSQVGFKAAALNSDMSQASFHY